jgi:(1->4)-alpha-D-glucan 1-alpha-D-glucosylmutase
MEQLFPGALDHLARLAVAALDTEQPGSDVAVTTMRTAIRELTVHLVGYRTYGDGRDVSTTDGERIRQSLAGATAHLSGVERRAAVMFGARLQRRAADDDDPWLDVVRRWQQLSGAVAAKGIEDTALYRYGGLLAQADVGATPDEHPVSPAVWHSAMRERARGGMAQLNTTSTHDSKRSEDVRARLCALSEAAAEWALLVRRWRRRHRAHIEQAGAPDAIDELVVYQIVLAIWPLEGSGTAATLAERVKAAVRKGAREAKRRTSWLEPDDDYEQALDAFVELLFGPSSNELHDELDTIVARIGPAAATNSLALMVLKVLAPGVPDVYQGCELWNVALVDPDNRRPVDFDLRRRMLGDLGDPAIDRADDPSALLACWRDARVKLHVLHSLLSLRRSDPELFAGGEYHPLDTRGPLREHVIAWERRLEGRCVIAVVPRQTLEVAAPHSFAVGAGVWGGTTVSLASSTRETFSDILSGATTSAHQGALVVAEALDRLPVAVLVGRSS